MVQKYKVFINDKIIFLVDDINKEISSKDLFYRYKSKQTLLSVIEQFEKNDEAESLFIFHKNLDKLLTKFLTVFTLIEAAGGIVKNPKDEILFIFRRNKWDLPKGKIEENEHVKDTAIREVEEECGVSDLTIVKDLPSTYHIYTLDKQKIIKKTHWFEMYIEKHQTPKPQTAEDITIAKWIKRDEIKEVLNNTYKSITELLTFYLVNS